MTAANLDAPFPWFGGKSRVADIVWQRFGADVANYVEPFFGSGAVLLGRPAGAVGTETVNDRDGFVSNFWRAIAADPAAVAEHADWPVNENDLHARHAWLVAQRETLTARLEGNPEFFDAKIAGWWCWGIVSWICGGWCSGNGPWRVVDGELRQRPHLGGGQGINRQRPHLGNRGQGVNRQLPHLGNRGQGINDWFAELSARLRDVRVCCGDWSRVCGPTPTFKLGTTGVFLDPPYGDEANRRDGCYSVDSKSVAGDVLSWCMANGDNPELRIALCGYDGEHNALESLGWDVVRWKARGGYGLRGDGNGRENATRERIWFSPHCLDDRQGMLLV
jgi:hypothetical protein